MLQIIRNMVKGWLAFVIVGLLIIPFAFWGINYYFEQGGALSAASVNGEKISLRDYQRSYQRIRQQWQTISDGNFHDGIEELLQREAINEVVQRELLRQTNQSLDLRISDAELKEMINRIEYFQGADGFDQALYESALSQSGLTPALFESRLRQDAMTAQLQSAVSESVFITEKELLRFAALINQSRDFSYAVLSSDAIKDGIAVSDADIAGYYDGEARQFQVPEKVSLSYVVLSLEKIADAITIDESDLLAYYETNKAIYSLEEQRKIKQVMVNVGEDASAEDRGRAEAIAAEIYDLLSAGQSFAELAGQYADQQDLAIEFSEFGFLTRGILEAEVEEAAFALAAGEYSKPTRSKFGLHIVGVDEVQAVETSGFDSIREEVARDYKQGEAEKRFYELGEQLAALAFEQPHSLDEVAVELELEIQQSDFFSRNEPSPGIISDPKIIQAGFSDEVLLNGNNSEVIELDNQRLLVLRVNEHQPEMKRPLSEVRERILTRIKYERASEQVRKRGEAILAELRTGNDQAEIGTEQGLAWREATGVRRDAAGIDSSILRQAFRLPRPTAGQVFSAGLSLANGDYALITLNDVRQPPAETIAGEEMQAIRAQLERLQANAAWSLFLRDLREDADVTVYAESL